LPIQAFFYLPEPGAARFIWLINNVITHKRYLGADYRNDTSGLPSKDATFACDAEDQAVSESGKTIDRYIQSATWALRPDPGTGEEEWSLSVVLTELGKKQTGSSGSDAVYAELVRKYKNDFQWKQKWRWHASVVCHLQCAIRMN
jgi:hypothetical protein